MSPSAAIVTMARGTSIECCSHEQMGAEHSISVRLSCLLVSVWERRSRRMALSGREGRH